jgi:predicted MFS family arabinose efflux permease
VADITTPQQRARAMGLIGAAFGVGFIAGPAIGAASAAVDVRLPFFVAAGLATINFALAWVRLPESLDQRLRARTSPSRLSLLRRAFMERGLAPLVWMSFVATLAFVGMEATFALFVERRLDFGPPEVAWAFVYIGLLAAASQGVFVGRLVGRYGESRVLLAGLIVTGVGLGGLAFVTNVPSLLLALLPLSFGSGLVFATTTALISRSVSDTEQGVALGITASVSGLARIGAPLGATALFQAIDPGAPLVVGGVLFLGCAVAIGTALARGSHGFGEVPITGSARDV